MVSRIGIEPMTHCLKGNCSTVWANGSSSYPNKLGYSWVEILYIRVKNKSQQLFLKKFKKFILFIYQLIITYFYPALYFTNSYIYKLLLLISVTKIQTFSLLTSYSFLFLCKIKYIIYIHIFIRHLILITNLF